MFVPDLKDEGLLADIASAPDDGINFHLWWLGQSGFLVKWQGSSVLLDPYLSDSLTVKYAGTDKEHIRMTERCIAPERLGFVDIVTSSHAHTDHFDAETLIPIARAHRASMPLVLPASNVELGMERLAGAPFQMHGIDEGQTVRIGCFEFIGIPAAHDSIERDAQGRCRFLGLVVRFGPWTVYHSGDTCWYDELPHLLAPYQPDIALLPINGHDPGRRVAGNLNGIEAAALAKACGAAIAIPHHFDMFTFNTESPDDFVSACANIGQSCRVLQCGERWSSAELDRPLRASS
jgi:L-ascorbate metabolism protein UlaG (beta-lactamase superfamily)